METKEYQKQYRERNRERIQAYKRNYYLTHKTDLLLRNRKLHELHKEKYRETQRKWELKQAYGLTTEELQALWQRQKGLCGLCHQPLGAKFVIDHDHQLEKVRGLLHNKCNIGLSYVETYGFWEQALTYLRIAETPQPQNSGQKNGDFVA